MLRRVGRPTTRRYAEREAAWLNRTRAEQEGKFFYPSEYPGGAWYVQARARQPDDPAPNPRAHDPERLARLLRGAAITVSAMASIFFISGGWVYRTECSSGSGKLVSWDLGQGPLPYFAEFTDAPQGCQRDSLVRYLVGNAGILPDHTSK